MGKNFWIYENKINFVLLTFSCRIVLSNKILCLLAVSKRVVLVNRSNGMMQSCRERVMQSLRVHVVVCCLIMWIRNSSNLPPLPVGGLAQCGASWEKSTILPQFFSESNKVSRVYLVSYILLLYSVLSCLFMRQCVARLCSMHDFVQFNHLLLCPFNDLSFSELNLFLVFTLCLIPYLYRDVSFVRKLRPFA